MNPQIVQHEWWWLLGGLVSVALTSVVLRSWLHTHRRPSSRRAWPAAEMGAPEAADAACAPGSQGVPARPGPTPRPVAVPHPAAAVRQLVQDAVTGLSTRLRLEDQLASAVMRADARQRRLALLYIDLDGFHTVNDTLGYGVGDAVLRELGRRLQGIGRTTDTIARLDGDAFMVMLDGDPDMASAGLVAERVREALQAPCIIEDQTVTLSCSIGIVLYPDHGPRAKLIGRADAAMLAAKQAGGNGHCFFDEHMDDEAQGGSELQRDLRQALHTHEGLSLHYQPMVDGRIGHITGVEALLNWQHPRRGQVSATVLVAVAERYGLIATLGHWVLHEACAQTRRWMDAGLHLPMSINLSGHQLRQADLVVQLQQALSLHRVPPELLTFEVSESAAMEDAQASQRAFQALVQTGVGLALDGFGTGYSNLRQLRQLPIGQLKLDRSLLPDAEQEGDARDVVHAVISLGHALGLSVVAEGVETEAQQLSLQRLGCDQLQGHRYAPPLPAERLLAWATGPDLPAHWPSFQQAPGSVGREGEPGTQTRARTG